MKMGQPNKKINNQYFEIPFQLGNKPTQTLKLLSCGARDQVSIIVLKKGWKGYENPLPLLIAQTSCHPQTIFLDIGANTGYYSLISAFSGAQEIRAFEPVPFIADILEANRQINKPISHPISLHRIALSDENKEASIFMPDNSHGLVETSASLNQSFRSRHSAEFKVTCQTLDTHIETAPLANCNRLILKVDVESLEPEVLKGSQRTISRHRPLIFLEILPESNQSFFYEWAYKNDYSHAILRSPNKINPTRTIEGSLSLRDHIFYPSEKPLQKWFQ